MKMLDQSLCLSLSVSSASVCLCLSLAYTPILCGAGTCDISVLTSACDGVAADDKSFCESQCHTLAVSMVGACKQQSADIFTAVSAFLGNCDAGGH
jgi:hypothetical protein